jgi:hypothetical protein
MVLGLGVLATSLALSIFSGCVSSQPNIDAAAVVRTEPETKVGVIDMMEILKRTKVGQPAFAKLERDVEELSQPEPPEPWYLYDRYRAYYPRPPKRWNGYKSFSTAVAPIMPKVETVVQALAEKNGFEAVLQKGTSEAVMIALYYPEMVDLTNEVIDELNRRYP